MVRRISDKELGGRSGIALEVKEYAIDPCIGIGIDSFRDSRGLGHMLIDKTHRIIGKRSQVAVNRLVGAMDIRIERRIVIQ